MADWSDEDLESAVKEYVRQDTTSIEAEVRGVKERQESMNRKYEAVLDSVKASIGQFQAMITDWKEKMRAIDLISASKDLLKRGYLTAALSIFIVLMAAAAAFYWYMEFPWLLWMFMALATVVILGLMSIGFVTVGGLAAIWLYGLWQSSTTRRSAEKSAEELSATLSEPVPGAPPGENEDLEVS